DLLAQDDRNVLAYNNVAVLLALHEGKHEEALASIDKAIELAGPQPDLLDTRAIVYLATDKPERASDDLDQAQPPTAEPAAPFRLACAHLASNNNRAAREAYKRAKDEGFTLSRLHPLERPGARKALAVLQSKD